MQQPTPGAYFVRSWSPVDTATQTFSTEICLYDGGHVQGILIDGQWFLMEFFSRVCQSNGAIQETGLFLDDSEIPLHIFAKETMPATIKRRKEHLQLSVPGWQLEWTFSETPVFQPEHLSEP